MTHLGETGLPVVRIQVPSIPGRQAHAGLPMHRGSLRLALPCSRASRAALAHTTASAVFSMSPPLRPSRGATLAAATIAAASTFFHFNELRRQGQILCGALRGQRLCAAFRGPQRVSGGPRGLHRLGRRVTAASLPTTNAPFSCYRTSHITSITSRTSLPGFARCPACSWSRRRFPLAPALALSVPYAPCVMLARILHCTSPTCHATGQ